MAIRGDASADALTRTTNLPSITAATIMAWVYKVGTGSVLNYESVWGFGSATSTYAVYITHSSTTTFAVTDWVSDYAGSTISTGVWYHLAMTLAGTGAGQLLGYRNGVLDATGNGNSGITGSSLKLFNDPAASEWSNVRLAGLKLFNVALSATEIAQEMLQYQPALLTNLNSWYPLLSATDLSDYGPNKYAALTAGGTLTTEDGPPIPWVRRPVARGWKGIAVAPGAPLAGSLALTGVGR